MANGRSFTIGELHYSKQVFGNDLNYGLPRVMQGYWFPLQPSDTAMTPNGNMWYPPPIYREDFSTNRDDFFLFIHEATHCWQHQHGINVMVRGAFERTYEYGALKPNAVFLDFNIEQQASIVADYVRLTQAVRPILGSGDIATYRAVIPFLPK